MSTPRVYITPSVITISKPGYDATNLPAVDYRYCSLDSRIDQRRPLEVGVIPGGSFNFGTLVNYSTTYPGIPAVDLIMYGSNAFGPFMNKPVAMRDAGSNIYQRTSFYLICNTSQFQIVDDAQYVRTAYYGTMSMFYILWKNW